MAVALLHHLLPLLMLSFLLSPAAATTTQHQAPTPEPWPEQFHAVLFMNYSNALSLADLWYDWPGGRNLHIIKDQLGGPRFFDLEWNNGTSFFYYKEEPLSCRSVQLDVGVLRPNWLDGATYLGRAQVDGFLCDAWTKADFIWYYQDVDTKRPVKWVFYTGVKRVRWKLSGDGEKRTKSNEPPRLFSAEHTCKTSAQIEVLPQIEEDWTDWRDPG